MKNKFFRVFCKNKHTHSNSLAFTLAETLIVMGIIGVVAALTLPNLNSSTADKEKVAKLQKIYQNLTDACGRVQAVYGPITEWPQDGHTLAEKMEDFIKYSKKCTGDRTSKCFTKTENCLSGDSCKRGITSDCWNRDDGSYILADGSSIFVFSGCSSNEDGKPGKGIFVDLDGPNKGTNTWGKDLFAFRIPPNATELVTDEAGKPVATDNDLKSNCFISGASCATWVIQKGNMDYLKATNGTCANNVVLSWSNTTCK